MKIFAQVDENNTVINVAVFGDEQTPTNLGWLGWIETTDNLKEQASVGDTYVPEAAGYPNGLFYSASPHSGWVLDSGYDWQPPADKPYPEGWPGPPSAWSWDDNAQQWVEIEISEA